MIGFICFAVGVLVGMVLTCLAVIGERIRNK